LLLRHANSAASITFWRLSSSSIDDRADRALQSPARSGFIRVGDCGTAERIAISGPAQIRDRLFEIPVPQCDAVAAIAVGNDPEIVRKQRWAPVAQREATAVAAR